MRRTMLYRLGRQLAGLKPFPGHTQKGANGHLQSSAGTYEASAEVSSPSRVLGLLLGLAIGDGHRPVRRVAQAVSGTILGTVTDASGAVDRGAKVTIVNEGTGLTRTRRPPTRTASTRRRRCRPAATR